MYKGILIHNLKISNGLHLLRFERLIRDFIPGQHIEVSTQGNSLRRAYSICSGAEEPFIEILIKNVPGGLLSPGLCQLKTGDSIFYSDATGYFKRKESNKRHYFIANGTGIAPFLSFIKSNKDAEKFDFQIIHGLSTLSQYDKIMNINSIPVDKYISCTSKDQSGSFSGRITKYLEQSNLPSANYYLCGSIGMIYEVMDILKSNNIDEEQILTEVYY